MCGAILWANLGFLGPFWANLGFLGPFWANLGFLEAQERPRRGPERPRESQRGSGNNRTTFCEKVVLLMCGAILGQPGFPVAILARYRL